MPIRESAAGVKLSETCYNVPVAYRRGSRWIVTSQSARRRRSMSRTLVVLTFIALIVVGVALGVGEACRSMAAERSVTSALTTHVLDVSVALAQVRLSIVSI